MNHIVGGRACPVIGVRFSTAKAGISSKKSGAKGGRTPDLLNAIQALYQLSYGPERANYTRFPLSGSGSAKTNGMIVVNRDHLRLCGVELDPKLPHSEHGTFPKVRPLCRGKKGP